MIGEIKIGFDKLDPVLGEIQTLSVVHGGSIRQVSEPKEVETDLQHSSVEVAVDIDWISETNVEQFTAWAHNLCEEFRTIQKKYLFEVLSMTTEAVGNVFDFQGRNFWDAQIEMLEDLEMHFDEYGRHNYKFPSLAKRLAETPPTPEQQKKMEELIKAKREGYYAQKRTRRLS